jgi:hypothetical protein
VNSNASTSKAVTEFQHSCQRYYVCYTFSASGLEEHAKKLASIAPDHQKNLIVGTGHPDEGHWHASIKIGDAIDSSKKDGVFADKIAKSFLTAMYSEWDEYYRHRLAEETGAAAKSIKCDLMGDLRLMRHCVVHNKSIVTDEPTKLKELKWPLSPGPLTITKEMLSGLIDQINQMVVHLEKNEPIPHPLHVI